MIFPNKKLMLSHSGRYRMLQVPASVAATWVADGVLEVSVEYVEAGNYLVVRPVRVAKAQAATARATSVDAKTREDDNHTAKAHFSL
jgi:hypothetical protein